MIPTDLAIAFAVIGWSPVTMITLIPADRHLVTASGTAALGGSIIDMSPRNLRHVLPILPIPCMLFRTFLSIQQSIDVLGRRQQWMNNDPRFFLGLPSLQEDVRYLLLDTRELKLGICW